MCGIIGVKGNFKREELESGVKTLKYRGPDSSGVFIDEINKVGLGHTRLSILDLSPLGHQPMVSESGDTILTFNGEVYNFNELKIILENRVKEKNKEIKFKSTSDTEVILKMYEEFGEECFKYFSGMFAICIYDKGEDKIILARDPMGKKPLYYSTQNNNLFFSSELKALKEFKSLKLEMNKEVLPMYFMNDFIPTPFTIYKDVYKLEPGSYLVFQDRSIKKNQKFFPLTGTDNFLLKISSASRQSRSGAPKRKELLVFFDKILEGAVKKRMVSDVPLGVFLSGGLDSSIVSYYASKINKENKSKEKIKTFSIGFTEPSFNESIYSKQVSEYLGTEHYDYTFTSKDVLDEIKNLGSVLDEPMADASIIPTLILSKFARKYVTVVLGGDGGDELFAGYPTFQAERFYKVVKYMSKSTLKIVRAIFVRLGSSEQNFSFSFKILKFLDGAEEKNIFKRHLLWLGSFNREEIKELLKIEIEYPFRFIAQYDFINSEQNKEEIKNRENNLLKMYARTYMMDGVMTKVDRASMHYSLETRSPLLDKDFVEAAFALPYKMKMRWLTTKYFLKKLAEGKLPENIIYRKKKGFGMPIGKWLKGDLKFLLEDYLNEKYLSKEIFNLDYVEKLKKEHLEGKIDHRKKLWSLIIFAIWYKRWNS